MTQNPQDSMRTEQVPGSSSVPCSWLQEHLWNLEQRMAGSGSPCVQGGFRLLGTLEVSALERGLDELLRRHEILRTRFCVMDGVVEQRVEEAGHLELTVLELSRAGEGELEAVADEQARRPFDVSRGPLVRATLVRQGSQAHVLLVCMHRLIADEASFGVLGRELVVLYGAFSAGRAPRLPEPSQYAELARKQRSSLRGERLESHLGFWKQRLAGATRAQLPTDLAPSQARRGARARQPFVLPRGLVEALRAQEAGEVDSPRVTMLAAFRLLLHRHAHQQEDMSVGLVVPHEGPEVLGPVASPLVLRTRLVGNTTFHALRSAMRETLTEALAHRELPFEALPMGPELLQALVIIEEPTAELLRVPELSFVPLDTRGGGTACDLVLRLSEGLGELSGALEYEAELFRGATIARMVERFQRLLEGIAAHPEQRVMDLPLMGEEERRQLLVELNDTRAEYPRETCVHQLFEAQAERTPEALAVSSGSERVTYGELNRRANQLAHLLRRKGAGPETLVALSTERSVETVVGILGILKAGGAYVPLDPAYPRERLAFMLEDTRARMLVTQSKLVGCFSEHGAEVLCLDTLRETLEREPTESVVSGVTARNLAYVIYTSGSTGRPKGAMIEHQGVSNYLTWSARDYRVEEGQGAPVHSSISFDLTVTSLILPLVVGRPVVMVAEEAGVEGLGEVLRAGGDFSLVKLTPTHLRVLSQQLRPEEAKDRTRAFVIGGEGLTAEGVAFWRKHAPQTRLINEYGPTETVVGCCVYEVAAGDAEAGSVPIGKPIANTQLYVLDGSLQLVPMGVLGELYIGGDGVGRGYLERPELTAERFIPDPFSGRPGARLYKTGDLVRRLADGNLDFIGRLDSQVKVRGFRIELGEIELALAQHPAVREAVVVVREDVPGGARLVAYVTAHPGQTVDEGSSRALLSGKLPEYMVPAAFVVLEKLPVTPNGKVDRKALPAPVLRDAAAFVAPRTPDEELVAGIWAQLLGVEKVGVHDNFFALGGNSLLAMQVASRLRNAFEAELPLRWIFDAPTVGTLARCVDSARRQLHASQALPLAPVPREGPLPLSFSQQQLWFVEQLEPGNPLNNLLELILMEGRLDVAVLEESFNALIQRHEVLRTVFIEHDGQPLQRLSPSLALEVSMTDLRVVPEAEREAELRRLAKEEARRPFDLTRGPLLRVGLLKLEEQVHVLVLTVHHIVFDGWSQAVLHRELAAFYDAFLEGRTPALPPLPIQYADYAHWQQQWLRGEVLENQLAYWREKLSGPPPRVELPTDRPRPAVRTFQGAHLSVELSRPLCEALVALSRQEGATLFMTLMAALKTLLFRYTQQTDVTTGYLTAGRGRGEVEDLIGFFVNTLALRVDLSGAPTFRELLGRTRQASMEAFDHQDLSFEQLVDALQLERDLSRSLLFQVMFIYQPRAGAGLQLSGLSSRGLDIRAETSRFDITLTLNDTEGGTVAGAWEYNTDLFDAGTIARLAEHYERLLQSIVAHPEQRITDLPVMGEEERRRVLVEWNDTRKDFPLGQTVTELFEAQARRTPDAVAVSSRRGKWTYAQLSREVARLAARLRERGVGTERVVALLMDRSLELLASVLGVFKAGGAYLPLDAEHPPQRIAQILERSGAVGVLVANERQEKLASALALLAPGVRPAEWSVEALLEQDGPVAELPAPRPEHLAYVIYTSGSTGLPKGAMLEQRGMLNHLFAKVEALGLTGGDVVAQTASQCFDISVWQLMAALLVGGQVHIIEDEVAHEPRPLLERVVASGISILETVPSLLRALLEELEGPEGGPLELSVLRWLIPTGEALPPELCRRWLARYPAIPVMNAYGPTECSDDVTHQAIRVPPGPQVVRMPIGRAVANMRLYVVDRQLRPVPLGVPGELCVGGVGVGRGYLGEPARTAEVFVPDPFSGEPSARLYRTGDLVRHLPGGELEFLGRIDHQVKVRGFRIELGEVEAVLEQHPAVRESVVVVREEGAGGARLVAYVAAHPGQKVNAEEVRAFVSGKLPEYMVPAALVVLEALPLTPNGKVDRKALPVPVPREEGTFVAPGTPGEELVAGIWAQLLGVARVGVHDNFFALGGHSLLAMQVASRLRNAFKVELPLRWLFEAPTVRALAQRLDAARRQMHTSQEALPLAPARREGPLPLSFSQQRLWFMEQLAPGDSSFNVTRVGRVKGPLEVESLKWSLGELCRRHEVLRTTFATVQGEPVQVISPEPRFQLTGVDLSGLSEQEREAELQRRADEEVARPFDLTKGPLLRVQVLRLTPQEWGLVVVLHHTVTDGWSMSLLLKELGALYEAHRQGRPSPLPELPIQYADYAVWQRGWLSGEVLEAQLAYWREQLAGAPAVLELPTDHPRPAFRSTRGAATVGPLYPPALIQALRGVAQEEGVTLFMLLEAAFHTLLHRYSGQEDISVGTTVAGRTRTETEPLIGMFVNLLVFRVSFEGEPTFRELLGRVREMALGAYENQEVPFEKLVEELVPERSLSHAPLFQAVFDMGGYAGSWPERLADLELTPLGTRSTTAKYDLTLFLMDQEEGGMVGVCEYSTELFEEKTVQRMLGHLKTLLEGVVAHPEQRLSQLPLLDEEEKRQLLVEWNRTEAEYPRRACIHGLFEEQAERAAGALAVKSGKEQLGYGELNARANQLAHWLRGQGVGTEERVVLCVERGVEWVVGALGILKAGGAYVPVDPAYPAERLRTVTEDSGAMAVVTQGQWRGAFQRLGVAVVCLDEDRAELEKQGRENPTSGVVAENLAYVIYTSGSTGKPKGVEVSHTSLGNLVAWHQREYAVTPEDRATLVAGPAFDASVWELWPYLTAGASLHVPSDEVRGEPGKLLEWMVAEGVTLSFLPTPLAEVVLGEEWPEGLALRALLTGGDRLHRGPRTGQKARLMNHYGPTENTVVTTWAPVLEEVGNLPPIGRPISNTQVYVLDEGLSPVPVGVGGELYIGGESLSRSYLGRPGLTAERFIPNPFSEKPGERLYRTGDVVRWSAGGMLEFLGRVDTQVKVRGFRIELGEVEAVLAQHPAVRESVVVVREEGAGGARLVAYVAVHSGQTVDEGVLRAFASEMLPEYMVPTALVVLEALPLTPNGKVDRKALPVPVPREEGTFVAPGTPGEELVAGIWAQLLGVARVGAHDNFFALGGHSLLATQAVSRLRNALKVELPLRWLFEAPTVRALAQRLDAARRRMHTAQEALPLAPVRRGGPLPLSFSQQRLWFMEQLAPGDSSFNVTLAVRVKGPLEVESLKWSLGELCRRHEVLRTTFATVQGEPVQVISPEPRFQLTGVDLSGLSEQEREAELLRRADEDAAQPFDLTKGPLLRVQVLRLASQEWGLLVALHHIVTDGWSMGLFFKELGALYEAHRQGRPSPLPELPIQYADYAVWQRGWLSGEVLEAQLAYWRKQLAGAPAVLELPTDHPRPAFRSTRGAATVGPLYPPALIQALRGVAQEEGVTLFMLLEATFHTLLHRYSGQEDISVGTTVAGRTRTETEPLIGMFINTLVFRVSFEGEPTFRELLGRVREMALGAYENQEVPFEKLVEELVPERSLSHAPLFQAVFDVGGPDGGTPERLAELELTPLRTRVTTTKFDLALLMVDQEEGGMVGVCEYSTELFEEKTVQRMLGHLKTLLEGVVAHPEQRLSQLPLLDEEEKRQLLVEWNATGVAEPVACLHELFEEQARRTPDAVAVSFEGTQFTYQQLERHANQLAHYLGERGVGPDVVVGLCMDRGVELVIGVLGILKAGGAWLPLDPAYPVERLGYMLSDTGAPVLVTQERLAYEVPSHGEQRVLLDTEWEQLIQQPEEAPRVEVGPENLAYVIYTSGSTGKPKGVLIEHRNVLNTLRGSSRECGMGPGQKVLQFASIGFDAAVQEMFLPLLNGGTLVFASAQGVLPGPEMARFIQGNGITHLMVAMPVLAALPYEEDSPLRTLVVGGEACPAELVERWAPGRRFIQQYGPTEASITAASMRCEAGQGKPPFGKPYPNTQLYVLDGKLEPVPVGMPGELYIGGAGVGRGYLGRPELTAGSFLPDPFGTQPGSRLYRTGDLVRYRADGNLEFVGRADGQVKLRGFRIELGEIEVVLARHPSVKEGLVVVREDVPGNKRLVAYVVPQPEAEMDAERLEEFMAERLPEYMVPSAFVVMAALPLTPNGKVDRKALPPPGENREGVESYVAPRNPVEELLAGIWAELLGVEKVGIHDNFFELGGHSLLSVKILSRVRDVFDVELAILDLFEQPTVSRLVEKIAASRGGAKGPVAPPLVATPPAQYVPLSYAQQLVWMPGKFSAEDPANLVPLAFRLEGALREAALARSLEEMVCRHEALRTTFPLVDGERVQRIHATLPVELPVVDLTHLPEASREVEALRQAEEVLWRPFDMANGPLLRFGLFRLSERAHVLFLGMHHVLTDFVSGAVFLDELTVLYGAYREGKPSPLPPVGLQYRDFTLWERQWLQDGELERLRSYWARKLAHPPAPPRLPFDDEPDGEEGFEGAHLPFEIPTALSQAARVFCVKEGITPFLLMLAVFQTLLARCTRQEDFLINFAHANRTRPECEKMLGVFANMTLLRGDVSGSQSFRELLMRVRAEFLEAMDHGDMPYVEMIRLPGLSSNKSGRSPVQSRFTFPNNSAATTIGFADLVATPLDILSSRGGGGPWDLSLSMANGPRGFVGTFFYRARLFKPATIQALQHDFLVLLEHVLSAPEQTLQSLPSPPVFRSR